MRYKDCGCELNEKGHVRVPCWAHAAGTKAYHPRANRPIDALDREARLPMTFLVWAHSPAYMEDARPWKCVAAFHYLQEALDAIARYQDAGVDVVFQSPADCKAIKATDRRVVFKPEAEAEHDPHCTCPDCVAEHFANQAQAVRDEAAVQAMRCALFTFDAMHPHDGMVRELRRHGLSDQVALAVELLQAALKGEAKQWPCVVCGTDMGWNRPSGVCSEACLRRGQEIGGEFENPEGVPHGQ